LEEFGIKQGRVEEVFEEGQGSCMAVEPMITMMMMVIGKNNWIPVPLIKASLFWTLLLVSALTRP
jgi:hypothetical protein